MKVIVDSIELIGLAEEPEQNNTTGSSSLEVDHAFIRTLRSLIGRSNRLKIFLNI
jgi:hypothetical protein